MPIRYVKQADIDPVKWDRTIDVSLNASLYGKSWFLDSVADTWDALIENDYMAVMPLVFRKGFVFTEIYPPLLTKYLGVFSSLPVDHDKINRFILHIPEKFKKINICMNRLNTQSLQLDRVSGQTCFELDLISSYDLKRKKYSPIVPDNIAIARENKLSLIKHLSLTELEYFLRVNVKSGHRIRIFSSLRQILSRLNKKGKAIVVGVYGPENTICSVAIFVNDTNSIILLYACTNQQCSAYKANYLIIDSFLRDYSGNNITIGFDYTDTIWNENLYHDFGAVKGYCYNVIINRLPALIKWAF
ncbi:MAG: hypothetical protein JXB24_02540 [Bacteroidales bacterium]|nr:hypothetical protein [Bacteroidales bacterium]